tara:strand:+ start:761 stop:1057 length:297 start_codon:yes stop_codon:yes gene_type:complete
MPNLLAAKTISLDEGINNLKKVTVSPVLYKGHRVMEDSQSQLCHALGYNMVVNIETEDVVLNVEKVATVHYRGKGAAEFNLEEYYGEVTILKSVVCGL